MDAPTIKVQCPFCLKTHTHGNTGGTRSAHCGRGEYSLPYPGHLKKFETKIESKSPTRDKTV